MWNGRVMHTYEPHRRYENGDSGSGSGVLIERSIRWLRVHVHQVSVAGIGGRHANAAFTIATIAVRIAAGSPGHSFAKPAEEVRDAVAYAHEQIHRSVDSTSVAQRTNPARPPAVVRPTLVLKVIFA